MISTQKSEEVQAQRFFATSFSQDGTAAGQARGSSKAPGQQFMGQHGQGLALGRGLTPLGILMIDVVHPLSTLLDIFEHLVMAVSLCEDCGSVGVRGTQSESLCKRWSAVVCSGCTVYYSLQNSARSIVRH